MIKKLLIKIENRMIGRIGLQRMFEMLHRISVRGMNYMKGHTVGESGELWAMSYVNLKLQETKGISPSQAELSTPGESVTPDSSAMPGSSATETSALPLIFDVGANKGYYAECLFREFGNDMRLLCFEPARQSHTNLSETLKSIPPAEAIQIGFGKVNAQIELHYNHEGSTIATLYPMADMDNQVALDQKEVIEVRRIEDYCREEGIKKIDFLKVDVEGAEYDVLEGCGEMLNNGAIRFVQFEFGPNNMVSKTYMKDFFRVLKHYRIYRIVQNGVREIPQYHEIIEIPLVVNFLAEYRA